MSIKLPMDAIESARIVSAYRGRTMTDLMGDMLRPALAESERKARATGRTYLDRSNAHVHGHPDATGVIAATFPTAPVLYRMTVEEYERIGEMLDDPRVELIDGHLVKKMPKNPEHSWSTKQVFKGLERLLPAGGHGEQSNRCGSPRMTSRNRTCRSFGVPTTITCTGSPGPPTWRFWSRSLNRRYPPTGARSCWPMPGPPSPSTGSSTWSTARSKSTPARVVDDYATRQDFLPGQQVPLVIDGQHLGQIAVDDVLPLPLTNP